MPIVKVENAGQFGVIRDAFAHELPMGAWSDGRNVRFGDGFVERMKGHQVIYDPPSVEPYFLQPYSDGTSRRWLYAGASKLYSVSGGTHTNITRQTGAVDVDYTATAENVWSGGVLGGVALLNNGTDHPQQWGGSGKAADLSNWPTASTTRCKALRSFKYSLVAMNITEGGTNYPHMVWWSHPADPGSVPGSWSLTDAAKDSGRNNLTATPDRLIDGATLADNFYCYKESSIYRMSYIGAPDIYRFSDPISTQAGALALNCIAPFPGGHLVLGQGDIFIFNGAQVQSAISGRMRRWLQSNMDGQYYQRSFVASHPTKSEIWVCIPVTGSSIPNMALVWNWETNTWTFRELPGVHHAASGVIDATAGESFDTDTGTFEEDADAFNYTDYTQAAQRMVMADDSTKLYLVDSTKQFDGVDYSAYVVREGMDLGDSTRIKLVKSVRPRIEGSGTVYVTVGGTNDLAAATTWGAPQPFVIGSTYKVDTLQAWRYVAIKFETTAQATWRLKSFDLEFEDAGGF